MGDRRDYYKLSLLERCYRFELYSQGAVEHVRRSGSLPFCLATHATCFSYLTLFGPTAGGFTYDRHRKLEEFSRQGGDVLCPSVPRHRILLCAQSSDRETTSDAIDIWEARGSPQRGGDVCDLDDRLHRFGWRWVLEPSEETGDCSVEYARCCADGLHLWAYTVHTIHRGADIQGVLT
jgi:hypothetical protein